MCRGCLGQDSPDVATVNSHDPGQCLATVHRGGRQRGALQTSRSSVGRYRAIPIASTVVGISCECRQCTPRRACPVRLQR